MTDFVGNTIIVLAQVVVGVQMCWEEKFVNGYNIPALLVSCSVMLCAKCL
eukprot:SAG31_NODE_274_length_18666_cov_72.753972_16_plen_50_part_00